MIFPICGIFGKKKPYLSDIVANVSADISRVSQTGVHQYIVEFQQVPETVEVTSRQSGSI